MKNALITGTRVNGFKSISPLISIPKFDIINGCVIDYMHSVCLGVCRQLLEFWFDSENHSERFYIGRRITDVDKRLTNIKPPSFISRTPSSLVHRKLWHANELRCWLLYYGVPCLSGILPRNYFKHFCLLSSSIYILLKSTITNDELAEASNILINYVELYER